MSDGPLLLTMNQAASRLGCGKSTLYELIKESEILQLHLGRAARIPASVLEEFVERRLALERRERAEAAAWALIGQRRRGRKNGIAGACRNQRVLAHIKEQHDGTKGSTPMG
jgi:excisionase family DNA binding protein